MYPNTHLRFHLNAAAAVRVVFLARVHGHWRDVAKANIHGRSGTNSDLLAGRWHGHLVPARQIRLQIETKNKGHWVTHRTLRLTVRPEH